MRIVLYACIIHNLDNNVFHQFSASHSIGETIYSFIYNSLSPCSFITQQTGAGRNCFHFSDGFSISFYDTYYILIKISKSPIDNKAALFVGSQTILA